jgi:peptide deformylase
MWTEFDELHDEEDPMPKTTVQRDDTFLREEALDLPETVTRDMKEELFRQMIEFAEANNLIGLAANQVGHPWRVIVVRLGSEWVRMVNPKIVYASAAKIRSLEGCLSVRDAYAVERHGEIMVDWGDERGANHREYFGSVPAIIVQHEIDHLNGVLICDARP